MFSVKLREFIFIIFMELIINNDFTLFGCGFTIIIKAHKQWGIV